MGAVKTAVIIGGGLGGLTVATALQRAGIASRIIEVGKPSDRLGTGIVLMGNCLRALDQVGLADPCIENGFGFDTVTNRDAAGNLLSEDRAPRTFKPDRPGAAGIMRTTLGSILEDSAIRSGAKIDFGTTAKRIEQTDSEVVVELSTGEVIRTDLLVAADGAYSKTRHEVFGPDFKPAYCGQGVWRYTARRPDNLRGFTLYRSASNTVIGAFPLSPTECYFFCLRNEPTVIRKPDDRLGQMFKELLVDFSAPELVEAGAQIDATSHITYRPFDVLLMPPPWHKGRVVLLGDSAHSFTPQLTSGGGMAIEDAIVLADELSKASDVRDALAAYGARRQPRVKPIWETSHAISRNEQDPAADRGESMKLLMSGYRMLADAF